MQTDLLARLGALIQAQAHGLGFVPSPMQGVVLLHIDRYLPRAPTVYAPCIVIVAQGHKICTLNDRSYRYDAQNCLTLTLPLPVETETFGSAEEPFLGLAVGVTPALITDVLLQMDSTPAMPPANEPMVSVTMEPELLSAAVRLVETMAHGERTRVLGQSIVRELVYLVLSRPGGRGLRRLAVSDSRVGRIAKVVQHLQRHDAAEHDIAALARDAGMSLTTFHTAFKAMTGESPLQYLKKIRLHRARELMVNEGLSVQTTALRVGYESASQFSREFKRLFGQSPSAETARLRSHMNPAHDSQLRATLSFNT